MTRGLLLLLLLLLLAASLVQGAPCDGGRSTCDITRCTESSKTSISSASSSRCGCTDQDCGKGCTRCVSNTCHEYYTYVCESKSGYDKNGNDCAAGKYNDNANSDCTGCASGKYITVSFRLTTPRGFPRHLALHLHARPHAHGCAPIIPTRPSPALPSPPLPHVSSVGTELRLALRYVLSRHVRLQRPGRFRDQRCYPLLELRNGQVQW